MSLRAAEYVLGTLEPEEARRFETSLEESREVQDECIFWEKHFAALGLALTPVEPPAHVWEHIAAVAENRHGGESDTPAARETGARRSGGTGWWRALAVAASIAAIVLAALLFTNQPQSPERAAPQPAFASLIHDKSTGTSWLITAHPGSHRMSVVTLGDYNLPSGKILRAWLKPAHGSPILIGKLPPAKGAHHMKVSNAVVKAMQHATAVLVTREDASHEGQPKPGGKLLWKAPVAQATG